MKLFFVEIRASLNNKNSKILNKDTLKPLYRYWRNPYQIKSLQCEQKVGCLKKRGRNLWSLTTNTFFFFRAPFRARSLKPPSTDPPPEWFIVSPISPPVPSPLEFVSPSLILESDKVRLMWQNIYYNSKTFTWLLELLSSRVWPSDVTIVG